MRLSASASSHWFKVPQPAATAVIPKRTKSIKPQLKGRPLPMQKPMTAVKMASELRRGLVREM